VTEETKSTEEIAAETMLGDLLKLTIGEIQHMPDVWARLPEEQQQAVIDRATKRVQKAINEAVHILASEARPTLTANVEKVEFKDGVKAQLAMSAGNPARHDLADAQGEQVLIVVLTAEQHMGGADDVQPDPDQPALNGMPAA